MRIKTILLVIAFLSIFNLNAQTKKALFIGNSYTQVNDLPQMVSNIASSENKTLIYETHLAGGARFKTHWENISTSGLLEKMQEGDFDYIVLQGQSQEVAFPNSQFDQDVYLYAKKLDSVAKLYNPNSKVVFYMTWGYRYGDQANCPSYPPFCTFWSMSQRLYDNYLLMATDFNSMVCPVGAAWRESIIRDSTIVLHSSDNSHPTPSGTYLSSCLFYSTFFKDSVNSTYNPLGMNSQDRDFLQNISNTILFDSLQYWLQSDQTCNIPTNLSSELSYTASDSLTVVCNLSWQSNADKFDLRYKKTEDENWIREVITQNSHQLYLSVGNWQWRVKSLCAGSQSLWKDTIIAVTVSITDIKPEELGCKIYYSKPERRIIVEIENINQRVEIELLDINGKTIKKQNNKPLNNKISSYFEAKTLIDGIYVVRLKGQNINSNHKIIKN